jgi:hypothetical protein
MQILAQTISNRSIQLQLPFSAFIEGALSSCLAATGSDEDPFAVFEECLPYGYEDLDDEQLVEVLEETCVYATSFAEEEDLLPGLIPTAVWLTEQDLAQFKYRYLPNHGFKVLNSDQPIEAA